MGPEAPGPPWNRNGNNSSLGDSPVRCIEKWILRCYIEFLLDFDGLGQADIERETRQRTYCKEAATSTLGMFVPLDDISDFCSVFVFSASFDVFGVGLAMRARLMGLKILQD